MDRLVLSGVEGDEAANVGLVRLGEWAGRMSAILDITIDHSTRRELDWERVGKLPEEAGETFGSFIGWLGTNPRKGRTHELADVLGELLDVAVSALGVWEHLSGNRGTVGAALLEHLVLKADRLEPFVPVFVPGVSMVLEVHESRAVVTVVDVEFDRWGLPSVVHVDRAGERLAVGPRQLRPSVAVSVLDEIGDARCVFWTCADVSHRGVTWSHDAAGSVASCDVCGRRSDG